MLGRKSYSCKKLEKKKNNDESYRERRFRAAQCCDFHKHLFIKSDYFLETDLYKFLKRRIFESYANECMRCRSRERLQIDHIMPRSRFPHLGYDIMNMQILCIRCNTRKSNTDYSDYRPKLLSC